MYLSWNGQTISDFSDAAINSLYNEGYVFTRLGRGVAHQTRSIRANLAHYDLSSENRRVLKKTDGLELSAEPLPYAEYGWQIGKTAKDFYDTKFGKGVMSANKIKELMTDARRSNFNRVFVYATDGEIIGYCITLETDQIIHYSYPFYSLLTTHYSNLGMAMMLRAILYAKEHGKKYIHLGSAQRPTDTYKLQFAGLEWFDGKQWQTDIQSLKTILNS